MHILHVVGARPNFMKVAPVLRALATRPAIEQTLLHTGQHYDANMSDIFFEQLGIPRPDIALGVGSGTHAQQTAQIMVKFEEAVVAKQPDWVLVYGDVNSTVAAAIVCAKLRIPVAHVEAGLRSFDRDMPEEINRLVTDQLADLLLTPSVDGDENLKREGIPSTRIRCVGNVMIDTLVRLLPQARLPEVALSSPFALVTLHRPSNVDEPETLREILTTLIDLSADCQMVFPVHPRTRKRIADLGLEFPAGDRFLLLEPLGYLECLALQKEAKAVVTDSGGIQEESTYLGVPCLTLRENTERPVTITDGSNQLIGTDMELLRHEFTKVLNGRGKQGRRPPLWEGRASERIADILTGHDAVAEPLRRAA
ncbi:MAG TPA: UDP-N-acetylglucosamine 2-epimerase (non-hydrolyzing) [Planctomycetaceae bacterium]|nr:UDP-N-acetylglucosamine 2-epimerase (non-hydrolyzing) [Planctomycetaceae bacterium]